MSGWIKLDRRIENHPMWLKEPFTMGQAWVDLLLIAKHKDERVPVNGNWILLKRGQIYRSILSLSNRWQWSRGKTKRFLELLKADNMIDFECSIGGTTNGTTITIVNYDFYQGERATDDTTNGQRSDNERTTDDTTVGQRTDIYKNNKNIKNDKEGKEVKNNIPPLSPQGDKKKTAQAILKERNFSQPVEDVVEQWLKYKIEKHQPYKETGLNQLLNKIERWANDYGDVKVVEVITRTMASNYQGIVEEWFRENRQQTTQTRQTENFYDRLRKAVNEC